MPLIQWIFQNNTGSPPPEGCDEGSELPATVSRTSSVVALAATTLAASLGAGIQWQTDDYVPPPAETVVDEDASEVARPLAGKTFALYLPDGDEAFVTQVDEDVWQVYSPPSQASRALYQPDAGDDLPIAVAATIVDEDYDSRALTPWSAPRAQPLPAVDDEIPADILYGISEEDPPLVRAVPLQVTAALYQPDLDDGFPVAAASIVDDDQAPITGLLLVASRGLYLPDAQDEVTTPPTPLNVDDENAYAAVTYPQTTQAIYLPDAEDLFTSGIEPEPDTPPLGAGDDGGRVVDYSWRDPGNYVPFGRISDAVHARESAACAVRKTGSGKDAAQTVARYEWTAERYASGTGSAAVSESAATAKTTTASGADSVQAGATAECSKVVILERHDVAYVLEHGDASNETGFSGREIVGPYEVADYVTFRDPVRAPRLKLSQMETDIDFAVEVDRWRKPSRRR